MNRLDVLTRAGYSKTVMITLTWLVQTEGASSGGILASHPGTQERIDALKSSKRPVSTHSSRSSVPLRGRFADGRSASRHGSVRRAGPEGPLAQGPIPEQDAAGLD